VKLIPQWVKLIPQWATFIPQWTTFIPQWTTFIPQWTSFTPQWTKPTFRLSVVMRRRMWGGCGGLCEIDAIIDACAASSARPIFSDGRSRAKTGRSFRGGAAAGSVVGRLLREGDYQTAVTGRRFPGGRLLGQRCDQSPDQVRGQRAGLGLVEVVGDLIESRGVERPAGQ
jgi:hypothetical protein